MIREERADGLTRLVIDRPDRRNAFDIPTTLALSEALDRVAADRDCRVLVITGEGPVFSAGRDLKAEASGTADAEDGWRKDQAWVRAFHTLHRLDVPSVAVVRGYAVAGGFTLAMGCDFVLAEKGAKFGALEMKNGFPASVCTPILARLVGPRLGLELAMFGELVGAERLYEMGLINRLAADDADLTRVADDFIGGLLSLDPKAVALTRETFRAAETMPLDNALDMGKHLNQYLTASGWFERGAKQFLDTQKKK